MSTLAHAVLRAVPRTVIGTTLQAARLPVEALGRMTGRHAHDAWPPVVALDTAGATVETVLGGLLRDDELLRRGHLRRARLAKLRQAAELDAVADRRRTEADDELHTRREQVEQRRNALGHAVETREQQVEKQAADRKRRVRTQTAGRKQAARAQAAATQQAVDRRERAARVSAAKAEAEAVSAEHAALAAEDRSLAADAALRQVRDRPSS